MTPAPRPRGRAAAAVGAVAALILGTVAGPTTARAEPAAADSSGATAAIRWGQCGNDALAESGAECGVVRVPLDHANRAGRTIPIAVSRIPATAPRAERLGPLLVNPGGPGGPGLDVAAFVAAALPEDLLARYDVIGFDPRGIGESGPKLSCDRGYFTGPQADYVPPARERISGSERTRLAASTAYVAACQKRNGAALKHLRTIDVVRDMDLIRANLGARTISFVGFSYGTYIGQVYATTFPERTARMVLSGTVAPDGVGFAGDIGRPEVARAFETNIGRFFDWVARYGLVYGMGADAEAVAARYYADRDALRERRVDGIGPAEWADLFAGAVYNEASWAPLAQGWAAFSAGRTDVFAEALAAARPATADRFLAASLSVACSDGDWRLSYRQLRAKAFRTAESAPFATWNLHWAPNTLCVQWPVAGRAVRVGSRAAPPLLFVNGTLDAPTPYGDAVAARAAFPGSALIEEVGGANHAGSAFAGNACVDDVVFAYLRDGILPPRVSGGAGDVRCARGAEPGLVEIAAAAAGETLLSVLTFPIRSSVLPARQMGH